ncbi:uncharacterized protein ACA1_193110 [Acanthamoeba castellanii str. Neff]|uniref:MICOS complex subunit n=1 Tax=Acanthamoeba castellanii (strain ATCC 30010 / Neff) TaxID=1257118 RepID=L8GPE5_ACACF|nr:uncharacterized protein ACA1_193110 [Acanthamoeba castellanii str. Neff]ELR14508.1 hypothetical protein ACA1_193110 [Acanthamoeba castellanii str. Neff]
MKLARSQFTVTPRRAGLVLATSGGAAMLGSRFSLPSVHAHEKDVAVDEEQPEAVAVAAEAEESPVVSQQQWEEVWEEEKGTFLRPYITSVRIAAQETLADACGQWKSFKEKTDFDHKWGTTKHYATRYYWLLTGQKLGPEIAFAATTGVLTLVATRKVLRLPFRLALLSGGVATAALLPPYEKARRRPTAPRHLTIPRSCAHLFLTVPYLVHQYETFEWAKVADKFDPVAIKDAAIDELKASLPFGLGKSTKKNVEKELLEEKKEQHVDDVAEEAPKKEESHAVVHHQPAADKKACCHDNNGDKQEHKSENHHHHHKSERHHHDEEKEVLDVEPLSDKEAEDVL